MQISTIHTDNSWMHEARLMNKKGNEYISKLSRPWMFLLVATYFSCGESNTNTVPMDGPLVRIHVAPVDTSAVVATLTVTVIDPMHMLKSFTKTFSQGRLDLLGASFPFGTRGQTTIGVELFGANSCLLSSGVVRVNLTDDNVFDQQVTAINIPNCGLGPLLFIKINSIMGAGGSVTSAPNGINCSENGGTCQLAIKQGTEVALTATPDATSIFSGWGVSCSGTSRKCTVSFNADTQVIANFSNPSDCEQIRQDSATATDGNRTLYIGGDRTKPWNAYCVMSITPALTYLNLTNTGANQNFSQYTSGGAATGVSVRTNFSKLRIDPATRKIDSNDKRFASSSGSLLHMGTTSVTSMPYATSMGCLSGSANGVANVDLSGTVFAVQTGALALGGISQTGISTPPPNGQNRVLDTTGGGNCGWHSSAGATNPFNNNGSPLSLAYFP